MGRIAKVYVHIKPKHLNVQPGASSSCSKMNLSIDVSMLNKTKIVLFQDSGIIILRALSSLPRELLEIAYVM